MPARDGESIGNALQTPYCGVYDATLNLANICPVEPALKAQFLLGQAQASPDLHNLFADMLLDLHTSKGCENAVYSSTLYSSHLEVWRMLRLFCRWQDANKRLMEGIIG